MSLAQTRAHGSGAPEKKKAGDKGGDSPEIATARQKAGNAAASDKVGQNGKQDTKGPTRNPWLDGALAMAFGTSLGGLEASFGQEGENRAIGAKASTRKNRMSFGNEVKPDTQDPEQLEVVAHETAHALANGGSGKTPVDLKGDKGEEAADHAGKAFRRWAENGFAGEAPRLKPAHGGQAEVHRYSESASAIDGSPSLKRGSSGDLVKTLQHVLNTTGEHLSVDGDFGKLTDAAVRRFQASHDLDADGIVGPKTASALHHLQSNLPTASTSTTPSGSLTGSPALQEGSRGNDVKTLQTLLNKYGASIWVDGDFGGQTYAAVIAFQRANGLTVDGVVGPKTAGVLTGGKAKSVNSSSSSGSKEPTSSVDAKTEDQWRQKVLDAAASHLGARYYWGADGPSMFDCSGFALYVLRQDTGLVNWGDDTAGGICNRLPKTNNPKKGDMIFFWSGGSVEHVMIYSGSGSGDIGASGGGSHTFGKDPNACVKWSSYSYDSRPHTFGSIGGLIEAKLKK